MKKGENIQKSNPRNLTGTFGAAAAFGGIPLVFADSFEQG
jgi:hypothetical protein